MNAKKSYHISLNEDLINIAERMAESKSDAIEKALKEFVSGHRNAINGQTMVKPMAGQGGKPMASQVIVEFRKKLKENKETIEFLTANAKMLRGKIDQMPEVAETVDKVISQMKPHFEKRMVALNNSWRSYTEIMKNDVKGLDEKMGYLKNELKTQNEGDHQVNANAIRQIETRMGTLTDRVKSLEATLRDAKWIKDLEDRNEKNKKTLLEKQQETRRIW